MPKYEVTIIESREYTVEVQAPDEDEAGQVALNSSAEWQLYDDDAEVAAVEWLENDEDEEEEEEEEDED